MKQEKNKWWESIKVIIMLAIVSFIVASFISYISGTELQEGNVALIPIKGVITSEKVKAFGQSIASSQTIVEFIEEADKNSKVKAIILEINSPGGSPVATEEIANAIERVNKTTVAWIREVGASGGYWIAASTDTIVASRMSITGSIGVIASYLDFSGFLEDHNVSYERMVAGQYKDIGSPFKPMSMQERKMFQDQLDSLHSYFIKSIAKNRDLPEEEVREIATGMFYLGEEAKNLGLVDILGGKEDAKGVIEEELNITVELIEYKEEKTLLDVLSEIFSEQSFYVGRGIGESVFDARASNKIELWT
ncbi:MAG: signal peptide peptidase SppA [Nanoarchaeota archaeon]|nr:signal peptide peptidase SppA [Nanoarchaeota archaeon]